MEGRQRKMASKNKIIEMIASIKTIYPYYAKDTDVEMLVQTWTVLLKDYSDQEIQAAFYKALQTCKMPPTPADIIEKIDIGGISLIRAAAKNHKDVVIVASKDQYAPLADILRSKGAQTTLEERAWFAKEAFGVSSAYDSAIFNYFDGGDGSMFRKAVNHPKALRYGENPHQKGYFYGDFEAMFDQIHGKEISYNNLPIVKLRCLKLLLKLTLKVLVKHLNQH